MMKALATALAGFLGLTACTQMPSTEPIQHDGPARLASEDADENLATLTEHLRAMMGRQQITLGADDPFSGDQVSVLPPPSGPLEGNNPALPTLFKLELRAGVCVLIRQDDYALQDMPDVRCWAWSETTQ